MKKSLIFSVPFVLIACGGSEPAPTSPAPAATEPPQAPAAPAPAAPSDSKPAAPTPPPAPAAPKPAVVWNDMQTPESVLYDEANDRYFVSNINGKPLDVDNNGFISELSPDGKITKLKFIEGGSEAKPAAGSKAKPQKIVLNAPKGTAIVKGVLYVADIDTVRLFDAKTGDPKGTIAINGATFLNDIAATQDGRIFVSDSGMKQGEKDFEPAGTDAVYVIKPGATKAELVIKGDLNRPNGLLWYKDGLYVNTFGSAEMFRVAPEYVTKLWEPLSKGGKGDASKMPAVKSEVTKIPAAALDGFAIAGDKILVSSWAAKTVFRGVPGGAFEAAVENVNAPADITYDTKRKRVLVPRFMDNKVEAYDLP